MDNIRKQVKHLGNDYERIWINPDCGLKTRKWNEVRPSMENIVIAAKKLREEFLK